MPSTKSQISAAIAPLLADPGRTAVFSDLDGTLAPIVDNPRDAVIEPAVREVFSGLAKRYGAAGIVSGRPCLDARRIIGLESLIYYGNHGFEALRPGVGSNPEIARAIGDHRDDVHTFTDPNLDEDATDAVGLRIEDKRTIVALHWRGAPDEAAAEAEAERLATEAEQAGLWIHRGRKVLELRPPVEVNKGTAMQSLLESGRYGGAFYAGDDITDIDAFKTLAQMREQRSVTEIVRVAVLSDEGPEDLGDHADLEVEGTAGLIPVLEALLAPGA